MMHWSLEKCPFTGLMLIFQILTDFILQSKKNTFINITINLIRKISKYLEADKLMIADTSLPTFTWKLAFYLRQQ